MSCGFEGIRAVYFDLDETLCSYWEAVRVGLDETFARYCPAGISIEQMKVIWAQEFDKYCPGIKKSDWYEVYLKSGGPTRTELMRLAFSASRVDDPKMAAEASEFYAEVRGKAIRLYDDALPVIEALRGKFYLGIITNGPADVQRQEVVDLGLERYFDSILIEGELGFGKPQPEVFQLAEGESGCKPEEILFVGNSYAHDVVPALAAGWKAIWVRRPTDVPPGRGGENALPEDLAPGGPEPNMVVQDLTPIPEALDVGP